jgi:hypothetical protein
MSKQPYTAPVLTVHGSIDAVTQSGSRGQQENRGQNGSSRVRS